LWPLRGDRSPVTTASSVRDAGTVFDERAIELAEKCHGVTSAARLRSAGLDHDQIRQLTRSRHWDRPTPTTFRRVGSATTPAQHLAIVVLDAGTGAALSHLSAARWWGLTGCALHPIHVIRTASTRRPAASAVVHRVRRLPPAWLTELDGIPIVRPELCALQLFAMCRFERAERLTETMWSMRLLSGPSLRRFIDDMGRMGRNGTAGVRTYLEGRPPGYVPAATGVEARFDQIMRSAGIAVRRQVDSGSEAWTGRVDFRLVEHPVIVEVQSERHHRALIDATADARRIEQLVADGFTVVEVWDTEVWTSPRSVVDRVRAAMARSSR
jgi:very-short-patch-repair endonuclease